MSVEAQEGDPDLIKLRRYLREVTIAHIEGTTSNRASDLEVLSLLNQIDWLETQKAYFKEDRDRLATENERLREGEVSRPVSLDKATRKEIFSELERRGITVRHVTFSRKQVEDENET